MSELNIGILSLQGDVAENVSQFFPLSAMSNLIKEPFTRLGAVQSAANQLGEELSKNYDVQWYTILIVLVWTFLFKTNITSTSIYF